MGKVIRSNREFALKEGDKIKVVVCLEQFSGLASDFQDFMDDIDFKSPANTKAMIEKKGFLVDSVRFEDKV